MADNENDLIRANLERLFRVIEMCSLTALVIAVSVKQMPVLTFLAIPMFGAVFFYASLSAQDYLLYLERNGEVSRDIFQWLDRSGWRETANLIVSIGGIMGIAGFVGLLTYVIFKSLPG